jgi:hypothetical protein
MIVVLSRGSVCPKDRRTGKKASPSGILSQTRRDLFRDPGAFFSPKLNIFGEALMIGRQSHEGSAGRFPRILQIQTSAETSLAPLVSAPKTASSCLAACQRFEQRLGHLRGPIDGVPIAINPRNDEAALHYSNEHQRKVAGVEAFRNFAVGLSFAESSCKDLLKFAEIAFDGLPQRGLGDGGFGSKSAHPATLEAVARDVEIADDPLQCRTVRSYSLARELAHFIGHLTESHRRQVHLSLEVVIEAALPRTTFFQQVARTYGLVAMLPHQLLGRLNELTLRLHDILVVALNQQNVTVFCN